VSNITTNQIAQIAELTNAGHSISEIAARVGTTRATVYRRLANGSVKKLIEIIQKDFIHECLPAAADNITKVIQDGAKLSNQQYRASERALESTGVLNTQSQSIYVQQIFSGNQITLSPQLQSLVDKHLSGLSDNSIDAEILNPDGNSRICQDDVHSVSAHTIPTTPIGDLGLSNDPGDIVPQNAGPEPNDPQNEE
jgi:hypothetical protein